jgi:hypothetical protein
VLRRPRHAERDELLAARRRRHQLLAVVVAAESLELPADRRQGAQQARLAGVVEADEQRGPRPRLRDHRPAAGPVDELDAPARRVVAFLVLVLEELDAAVQGVLHCRPMSRAARSGGCPRRAPAPFMGYDGSENFNENPRICHKKSWTVWAA